jgi:periplasmic protein TonB
VTQSSGHARLDDYTCELLMRRARFCPATDKRAKPVAGEWSSKMRWVYPESPKPYR